MKLSQLQMRGHGPTKDFYTSSWLEQRSRRMLFLCRTQQFGISQMPWWVQGLWAKMFELRPFLEVLGHVIMEPGCFSGFGHIVWDPCLIFCGWNLASPGEHLTCASPQPGEPSAKGASPPTLIWKGFEMLILNLEVFWQPGMLFRAIRHLDDYPARER